MKIEQLLAQYLYNSKELTLQGIGTFRLDRQIAIPSGDANDFSIPPSAISFEYNPRATEDEAFIDYIVQQTRKIKPLASADLDSFIALSKQFLNIGKPFIIDGIGTVQKSQQGDYEFIAGQFIVPVMEEPAKSLKEKKEEPVSFAHKRTSNGKQQRLYITVILMLIALAGLSIYYIIHREKNSGVSVPNPQTVVPELSKDTVNTDTAKKTAPVDTLHKASADSNLATLPLARKDSFNFKIIIKTYSDSNRANTAFQHLQLTKYGNRMVLLKTDSLYKLAVHFTTPLSDTTAEKDSIRVFFNANPKVEL